jgi:hypothetical protein
MEMTKEISSAQNLNKKKLNAKVTPAKNISQKELKEMHYLFSNYYEGHSLEVFQRDLLQKDDVILLRDTHSLEIKGFSTILKVQIENSGKVYHGIYSGDTVVAADYWGSSALGIMFLKYLWIEKFKNPMRPLYWFLISKGYKTYLMMANNFAVHYPRYEKTTDPHHQSLMDEFYGEKWNTTYYADINLIVPIGQTCHLKTEIADISENQIKVPRIKFFQEKNPSWQIGNELCCIAEMTLLMPVQYALKKFMKGLFK